MSTLAERIAARADRIHVDQVTITRTTEPDAGDYDPDTLDHDAATTTVWSGAGLVTIGDLDARTDDPGARNRHVDDYRGSLPVAAGAAGIAVGDTLTVTAAGWAPDLVDVSFRINVVVAQTYRSRVRLGLQRLNDGPRL